MQGSNADEVQLKNSRTLTCLAELSEAPLSWMDRCRPRSHGSADWWERTGDCKRSRARLEKAAEAEAKR